MASARRSSSTDKSKRLHDPLGSAADRLLADTCAKMRGVVTLGKNHYTVKPNFSGEETAKSVEELRERMNQLRVLEDRDVAANREMFEHLRVCEGEFLLSDAAVHIITHAADSFKPEIRFDGVISSLQDLRHHYKERLDRFREEHSMFDTSDFQHDRDETHRRRGEYERSRDEYDDGSGGEEVESASAASMHSTTKREPSPRSAYSEPKPSVVLVPSDGEDGTGRGGGT